MDHTAHNTVMSETTVPEAIYSGQTWKSRSGAVWTVMKRRSTPGGGVLNLLVSPNGARRWLLEYEVREAFEFVA